MTSRRSINRLPWAFGAWGLLVGAGLVALGEHDARPGDPGAPAAGWPDGSRIGREPGRPTLLIFLHPHCPCSRASVEQLAALRERFRSPVEVVPVLLRFQGDPEEAGGLIDLISSRLGRRPLIDPEGKEAARFGVATSGHVLVFDGLGRLRFSGGITPSRGHRGDNGGADWLLARFGGGPCRAAPGSHAVFGCPLAATGGMPR